MDISKINKAGKKTGNVPDTSKSKPIIGLVPLVDYDKESYWMLPGYMKGIEAAGGIPVMLPLTSAPCIVKELADSYDGFLFTGGQDVNPEMYGERKLDACGEVSPERDRMEKLLLDEVLKLDKPILGICRGIQFINAALGGTLYQDLPTQYKTKTKHHMSPPYDVAAHKVIIKENTRLYEILDKINQDLSLHTENLSDDTADGGRAQSAGFPNVSSLAYKLNRDRYKILCIPVNSYHHQAIKKLAPPLEEMALSEDGLIEAVYMPDKRFVWAVQWHPEFSYEKDENSKAIFKDFVTACSGR